MESQMPLKPELTASDKSQVKSDAEASCLNHRNRCLQNQDQEVPLQDLQDQKVYCPQKGKPSGRSSYPFQLASVAGDPIYMETQEACQRMTDSTRGRTNTAFSMDKLPDWIERVVANLTFDVSAIYPDVKKPSTYLQAPYSRIVLSDLYRKLGPGTYSVDYGSFSAIALQNRFSTSSWAKAQEATRLSQMPHFNFKDVYKKKKALKEKLGPGSYEYKSFLEQQERRPCSTKGIIETGEVRFKDRIRDCYPGPGTYGNPYALLEESEKRCVTELGIMDSKTAKCFTFPNMGSGLGPGTYNMKDGMNEMLKRVVSTRGPYETFTGDRTKPMICGHYATDKKSTELDNCNIKSFLDELETKDKKRHGVFTTLPRNPGCPSERIFWATVGQCPHETFRAAPGSYNIKPIMRKEYENQPPFWMGAKRFDRKAYQLLFGNTNPVGVGRYDTTKHEKYPKKIRYSSLYMNDTQRYLSNLERDKCLQERITPVNKGHWGNPASACLSHCCFLK